MSEFASHVARPARIAFAAIALFYGEIGLAVLVAVLSGGSALAAIVTLAIAHPVAIGLTIRNPHVTASIWEWMRYQAGLFGLALPGYPPVATRNPWATKANVYIP